MKTTTAKRRAITPIIATILMIAVTLVAAVAIGGFVFGLFGPSSQTALVQATAVIIPASISSGTTNTMACATSQGSSGFVAASNTGVVTATVSLVLVTYGGSTIIVAPTGGTLCNVSPGSTVYVQISAIASGASKGNQFTGYLAMSNGAQVVFAGSFT